MTVSHEKILLYIKEIYSEMYKHKDLLDKNYSIYTDIELNTAIDEIIGLLNSNTAESQKEKKSEKRPLREEIVNLNTANDTRKYLIEKYSYDSSNSETKEKIIADCTADELRHLFNILFDYYPKDYKKKRDIFREIDRYYESSDRTNAMRP